ncbi:hypothetical protein ACP4OV_019355 [Aristida adscensionis]
MDPHQPKAEITKTKEFENNFKVIMVQGKRKYNLEVIKPDFPKKARSDLAAASNITYPTVCLKTERAENLHAFFIMHNLHHKNILSLKVLAKSKTQSGNPSSVAAFVEPYSGSMVNLFGNLKILVDTIKHFPSSKFRTQVRDIITGLDFLWKNDLYHGNLNWSNVLLQDETVKLAGFEMKDMAIGLAQSEDLQSLIRMLEEVSNEAAKANQGLDENVKYCCDTLDSLIAMLRTFDQASLPTLKERVLEQHPFFWNSVKRNNLFAGTVSLKLNDENFIQRVQNSTICGVIPWDKNRKGSFAAFQKLVVMMNDYRERQKGKRVGSQKGEKYKGDSVEDFVKLICGAYTHWREIGLAIDDIIRACYPRIFIDMKLLVDESSP